MTDQRERHLSWQVRDSGESCSVLTTSKGTQPDFFQAAHELFQGDPRIASVSLVDGVVALNAMCSVISGARSSTRVEIAFAASPAGSAILFSKLCGDLIGLPPDLAVDHGLELRIHSWAERAISHGLRHVWLWSGAAEGDLGLNPSPADEAELLRPLSSLAGLVDKYRAAHARLRIGVDASRLTERETGAQVALVQWLRALAVRPDIDELVLFDLESARLPHYANELGEFDNIRVGGRHEDLDVFWRPSQPSAEALISVDRSRGRRLVVTVLDLIEFSNTSYHPDSATSLARRAQIRRYLAQADLVTGISDDVVAHLRCEVPSLDTDAVMITALGLDLWPTVVDETLHERPFKRPYLLVLGHDYRHKNREFAQQVWQQVCQEFPIDLVLAGLHVGRGSSRDSERVLHSRRDNDPGKPHIERLPHVSAHHREKLLSDASVVLYPTSAEGFGLIPHEAARLGTPTVFTAFGPLAELLPADLGCEGWDVEEYAARTLDLLRNEENARRTCEQIQEFGSDLTWERAATELVTAFRRSLQRPPQPHGLWERGGSSQSDPSTPLAPDDALRAATKLRFGRRWRSQRALVRVRGRLRRLFPSCVGR